MHHHQSLRHQPDPRHVQDGSAPQVLIPGQYVLIPPQTTRERRETLALLRRYRQQASPRHAPPEDGHAGMPVEYVYDSALLRLGLALVLSMLLVGLFLGCMIARLLPSLLAAALGRSYRMW